jgi:predicted PurR-regulated permease PerM
MSSGPVEEAEARAASMSTAERPLGEPGRPMDRRSPFFIGMVGAAGVAVTYALAQIVVGMRDMLLLIGLAFFLAVGFDPIVSWLARRGLPRWAAVLSVMLASIGVLVGFLAMIIVPLVQQATEFARRLPEYLQSDTVIGRLNERYHLQERVQQAFSGQGSVLDGLLGAGRVVFSAVAGTVIVIVLLAYFLADMPRIRRTIYRLVPNSRRPRAILIGDEIFGKIGSYVLGNLVTSLIAGVVTFLWLILFGVPYPVLLAIAVMLLDLIPTVGTIIAGITVSLVALTVSWPVAIATAAFYVVYQLIENYLIVPRVMNRMVDVPGILTVISILVGGTLLGIIGALVAIPATAAILLLTREILFPRLDKS